MGWMVGEETTQREDSNTWLRPFGNNGGSAAWPSGQAIANRGEEGGDGFGGSGGGDNPGSRPIFVEFGLLVFFGSPSWPFPAVFPPLSPSFFPPAARIRRNPSGESGRGGEGLFLGAGLEGAV